MLGLVVILVTLLGGGHARSRVRSGRAYEGGLYTLAFALVDFQVLVGVGVWVEGRRWESDNFAVWMHPAIAIAAVILVHVGMRRAANERWAAEAYKIASRSLLLTGLLLLGAYGVAESI